jgi:hypothetical protein
MVTEQEREENMCPVCGNKFGSQRELEQHAREQHQQDEEGEQR